MSPIPKTILSIGRPVGDVRVALLDALPDLVTDTQAPTARELAAAALVGYGSALNTIKNLRRAGVLQVVRMRKVNYRHCPVAEYAHSKMAKTKPVDGWAAWAGVSICTQAV